MSHSVIRQPQWELASPAPREKSHSPRRKRARGLRILFLVLRASQTVKFWKRLYFNLLAEEPVPPENRREMAKASSAWKNFYA